MRAIRTAEILLPCVEDMTAWSVVACDQFTSQPEYWQEADRLVGEKPSALRLILPEAWLGTPRGEEAQEKIAGAMDKYLRQGVFRSLEDSFVYLERTLPDGRVRRGLMAAVDLECYDYAPHTAAPIRATEGTVESRLPPRVEVRRRAPLEIPHVMLLMDDREDRVLGPLEAGRAALPPVYDFPLMLQGGRLRGWQVPAARAEGVCRALEALEQDCRARTAGMAFAVGDGNHSLGAAKRLWEELKPGLSPTERETHPARYSLVELVNLYEPALDFAPIHRVVFDTDGEAFREEWARRAGELGAEDLPAGEYIARAEAFCQEFLGRYGGRLDYIHGEVEARRLGSQPGSACLLLPAIDKARLFPDVARGGPLPRKSFSLGQAREKRYYLECRSIRPERRPEPGI